MVSNRIAKGTGQCCGNDHEVNTIRWEFCPFYHRNCTGKRLCNTKNVYQLVTEVTVAENGISCPSNQSIPPVIILLLQMLTDWFAMVITNSVLGRLHHLKWAAVTRGVPLKHFVSSFLILPVCVYTSGKINEITMATNPFYSQGSCRTCFSWTFVEVTLWEVTSPFESS